ncbi:hypothetical protein BVG16_02440 [Paenibacillus selenitireducens]|uniref:DUF4234 domain-containing protein n=1 Tax=Paenibacillus selenitireducens TaxID=1324314 RepID=A0A1T2XN25_9BACL|nr:DUF4234 domain-containing protein [Paenibacillus selenitireducens]OPA81205.1 hypothetical protein BVG16_02440 [Paenibacillus selenitireducens]
MVHNRSIGLAIVLSFITCGFYGIYWMYKIFEETRILSGDREGSAGLDLVLTIITCGLYGFYAVYRASKRLYEAELAQGNPYASDESVLILIVYIFVSVISLAIIQSKINKMVGY